MHCMWGNVVVPSIKESQKLMRLLSFPLSNLWNIFLYHGNQASKTETKSWSFRDAWAHYTTNALIGQTRRLFLESRNFKMTVSTVESFWRKNTTTTQTISQTAEWIDRPKPDPHKLQKRTVQPYTQPSARKPTTVSIIQNLTICNDLASKNA